MSLYFIDLLDTSSLQSNNSKVQKKSTVNSVIHRSKE